MNGCLRSSSLEFFVVPYFLLDEDHRKTRDVDLQPWRSMNVRVSFEHRGEHEESLIEVGESRMLIFVEVNRNAQDPALLRNVAVETCTGEMRIPLARL